MRSGKNTEGWLGPVTGILQSYCGYLSKNTLVASCRAMARVTCEK